MDTGTEGITLAHALCALDDDAQEAVCEAIEGHGLKGQEALALVSAYRTCEQADERRALLSAPLTAVRPSERTAKTLSALCTRLEEKLGQVQAALETLANFTLPDEGLTLPERRRLEAEHRKVIHQLFITAQVLAVEHLGLNTQEVTHETRNAADRNPSTGRGAVLGFCRKMHIRFYMSDNETSLLEAHTHAFADFGGVTRRGVYDRMATVVLGTIGKDRKPLWHPRFLEFAAYYGFEPYLCKPKDPDRKGKDERIFWYLERDFLRGSEFDSIEDLNNKVRLWLDNVANCRVHGTTRRVPDEAWLEEKPFLIALPDEHLPLLSPLTAAARVIASLSDVDSGSLDDYAHLDGPSNDDEEDENDLQ